MSDTGVVTLGDFDITTAGTVTGDWVTGFEGMLAASLQSRFQYGSGGTNCKVYFQTTLDQGATAIDIACIVHGIASENAALNLSGLTPKTTQVTPTDGTLTDDTAIDGILGDRFRVKIVSTGIYAASTVVSARVSVR